MRRQFFELLTRFRKDERGAFAMIFAVMAVALISVSGAAVDFTVIQQARTRAQVALDAAALALQPTIYNSGAATSIQTSAQALLLNRLADKATTWSSCLATNAGSAPCAYVVTPTIDTTNGQLTLSANMKIPTYFVNLVGVSSIPSKIVSVATRKKLALEVAMVLDNSGSMLYTMGYNKTLSAAQNPTNIPDRMTVLKSSATCAVNILFYGVTTCSASTTALTANTNVKMGLVPFTQEVNVGSSNSSATWIDRTGAASITNNNFDNDDYDNGGTTAATVDTFTGPVDRIALFSQIKDGNGNALSWGGCVEARKSPYDTNDTAPSTGDTLYTPYFAVDEPGPAASMTLNSDGSVSPNAVTSPNGGTFRNSYIDDTSSSCKAEPILVYKQTKTKCGTAATGSSSYSSSCTGTTTDSYSQTDQNGTVTTVSGIPSTIYNNPQPTSYVEAYSNTKVATNNYTNVRTRTYTYIFSDREYQERICKYTNAQMGTGSPKSVPVSSSVFGPNGDCPAAAVSPLSGTPATITTAISAMAANGGTNITEGSAWGFHVLSPSSPFTSKGGAYSSTTSKVMIIMTDGENTTYPGTNMNYDTYYSTYGFPWNNRLGVVSSTDTTLEAVMNQRLYSTTASGISNVCMNARNAGITIYTIGVDVADTSNPTANTALLTNCASQSSYAYFPNTATDLQNAFISIANQLAALRLAQ